MNIESIQSSSLAQKMPAVTSAIRKESAESSQAQSLVTSKLEEQRTANQPAKPSVEEAVKRLSSFVATTRPEISFSIDNDSGTRVIKIMDSQSKEVIRQIPSEEAIQIAQTLDKLQGLFVKDKA